MKMTSDQRRWQAESDARTLADYQEIMGDSKRKAAAIKQAKAEAARLEKSVNNFKAASNSNRKK